LVVILPGRNSNLDYSCDAGDTRPVDTSIRGDRRQKARTGKDRRAITRNPDSSLTKIMNITFNLLRKKEKRAE